MSLKQTLDGLLSQATRTGQPARVRLARGLTISVRMLGENQVALQLSRAVVYPATDEWKTVVQAWPGQCQVIKPPKPLKDATTYYLIGTLLLVPRLVEV